MSASLKDPWWTWASPSGDPAVYAAFTATEKSPEAAHQRRCPMCLSYVRYVDGAFARHKGDDVACRASGLPQEVAKHLLDCLLRGVGAGVFVREARAAGRVPRGPVALTIPEALARARVLAGLTVTDVAKRIPANPPNVFGWEGGKSPRVDSAVKWSAALGRHLSLRQDGFAMWVSSATAASHFLGQRRELLGLEAQVVAKRIGVKRETMRRWEQGATSASMTLTDLEDWAAAIDFRLVLVEGGGHEE